MAWLRRNPWSVLALAAVIAAVPWLYSTRTQDHHVRVAFDAAIAVVPGLDVQLDGLDVGKVAGVRYEDGQAIVTLGIDDGRAWPLRRGTRAAIRFGSTIGSGTRRIDLLPGPPAAPPLADGAILAAEETITPVEFDELFDTFNRETRQRARSLAAGGADILGRRGARLNGGLRRLPGAVDALDGVLADLAAQHETLRTLTPVTARVVDALAQRSDRVSSVVVVASETFSAFAERSREVAASLELLPGTLGEARTTLHRLRSSAAGLRGLLADVGPGARELAALGPELAATLTSLRGTMPAAQRTVDAALAAAPPLRKLAERTTPFLAREAAPALGRLTPMLECITPYAPELAGFISTWAGFSKNYDADGHHVRIRVVQGPSSPTGVQGLQPSDVARFPDVTYARARPPGLAASQPWLIPRCGYTSALLDPASDPEAGG